MSKETFFHAKRSHSLNSSSSVLGAGSWYVVLSTIVQMVSRGFTSREFASPSPFAIKFANPNEKGLMALKIKTVKKAVEYFWEGHAVSLWSEVVGQQSGNYVLP